MDGFLPPADETAGWCRSSVLAIVLVLRMDAAVVAAVAAAVVAVVAVDHAVKGE